MSQLQPPLSFATFYFLWTITCFGPNVQIPLCEYTKNQSRFEDLILDLFLEQDGGAIISSLLL